MSHSRTSQLRFHRRGLARRHAPGLAHGPKLRLRHPSASAIRSEPLACKHTNKRSEHARSEGPRRVCAGPARPWASLGAAGASRAAASATCAASRCPSSPPAGPSCLGCPATPCPGCPAAGDTGRKLTQCRDKDIRVQEKERGGCLHLLSLGATAEPKTKRKWPAVPRATRTKRKIPAAGRSRYALPSRRIQHREGRIIRETKDRREQREANKCRKEERRIRRQCPAFDS